MARRHLIDVEQYYRMAQVGLLAPDARVELIEGVIIDMAPIGSNHAGVVNFLLRTLDRAIGGSVTSGSPPANIAAAALPQIQLDLTALFNT